MGSLFKEILQLKALEVAYRTGPDALNDYLSGAIDYGFQGGVFALSQQRAGNLRVLAIGSRERLSSHPEVPTLHEMGLEGLDVPGFFGVLAPTGTPQLIIEKLNAIFREVVATPQTQDFIIRSGGEPHTLSSTDAQSKFIKSFEEWGRLIKIAKIELKG
jgi:tripartite-type tricarboxylate transporter receptor subunit TctC